MTALPILYEGSNMIVCVKPRGVLSAKDASGSLSVADLLAPRSVWPVHRLDREVSGLMVFAKNSEAAAALSAQDRLQKEYLAVSEKAPPFEEAELCDLLYHDRIKNKTYVVRRKRGGVKEARLICRVLQRLQNGACLLQIRLLTGRTHQIRVQLASRGCPLCGDRKYGAKTGGVLALCAYRLTLSLPNGQRHTFVLPDDFLPPPFAELRKFFL